MMKVSVKILRGLWILLLISTKIRDAVGLCTKPIISSNAVTESDTLKATFDEKSTVRLQCLPGYEPTSGSPQLVTCLNGHWTPPPGHFTCQRVKCGPPPNVLNGQPHFRPQDEYDFGQAVHYGCNNGFTMFGDSESPNTVHCLSNGTWSHSPRCVVVRCSSPSIPNSRPVEGGSEPYDYGAVVKIECNEGYNMTGTGRMVCLEHGWSSSPKCEAVCTNFLGLKSGHIADEKISASTTRSSTFSAWYPHYARLDKSARINAWSAASDDRSPWLQVDLDSPKSVTGIITQGAKDYGAVQYVSAFRIAYSNDGVTWKGLQDPTTGEDMIFRGNIDNNMHKTNMFNPPIYARFVRFLPWQWHERITVRMELLGCD